MSQGLLFEQMLERDLESIPANVADLCRTSGTPETLSFVIRFAAQAYSPSLHGKHAFLACAALSDLADELPEERLVELIGSCAVYVSRARQPWSEPPLRGVVQNTTADPAALDRLLDGGDLGRGEEWLSGAVQNDNAGEALLRVAARRPGESGHNMIVATASVRLARRYPAAARYDLVRPAIVELFASPGTLNGTVSRPAGLEEVVDRAIRALRNDHGSSESFHRLALLDAVIAAGEFVEPDTFEALIEWLASEIPQTNEEPPPEYGHLIRAVEPYDLARDCGALLESHAISRRLAAKFGHVDTAGIIGACRENLLHGESFADWGFS